MKKHMYLYTLTWVHVEQNFCSSLPKMIKWPFLKKWYYYIFVQYSLNQKVFTKKKLLPRNVWSELCKCLLTWIWPQWTTMFLFLLYSCFLLFILWGSVLKKIIMLANSYIHKKDISIVYVYHVNLVKLYTIYHRKMMLLFFFLCIHIKGLVFLLANMVNYWMCCWWLILLSHVIDMVTFVMVTKWCQRTRRPRIVGSMAQKGDCGKKSQSKKSSSFSDDSLGIPFNESTGCITKG